MAKGEPAPNLRSHLKWLLGLRIVVAVTLLLAALIIQFVTRTLLALDHLYYLTAAACALSLLSLALGRWIKSAVALAYIQLAGDLLLVTGLVYITGGIESGFSFLYLIAIIVASMLLWRRGGLVIASGAAILYGALVDLMFYHVVPMPAALPGPQLPWPASRLYYNLFVNFSGFYATALLTSLISENLRLTRAQLVARTEDLAELQALNQNIINSISSGLITTDLQGEVTFVNRVGEEILAAPAPALRGRPVADLLGADLWRDVRTRSLVAEPVRFEQTRAARGAVLHLGFSFTTLRNAEGQPDGYIFIFQDLTEIKKLEGEIRLKGQMAAVGELAANIAHEIRNPLAAISGSVQVLQRGGAGSPEDRRLMDIILQESNRLDQTLESFLRYVRPRARSPIRFDVATSLNDTLLLLGNSPEVTPLHKIDAHLATPMYIHGDPDQLRQIWWNLAKNAVRAMPEGGILTVRSEVRGERLAISFHDNGRGMTSAQLEKLFQPFKTSFDGGAGLGMAIVYRIVEQHHGLIFVDSRPNEGTTVSIELPVG